MHVCVYACACVCAWLIAPSPLPLCLPFTEWIHRICRHISQSPAEETAAIATTPARTCRDLGCSGWHWSRDRCSGVWGSIGIRCQTSFSINSLFLSLAQLSVRDVGKILGQSSNQSIFHHLLEIVLACHQLFCMFFPLFYT